MAWEDAYKTECKLCHRLDRVNKYTFCEDCYNSNTGIPFESGSTSLDDSFRQRVLVTRCKMCGMKELLNDYFVCKSCFIFISRSPGVPTLSLDLTKDELFKELQRKVQVTADYLATLMQDLAKTFCEVDARLIAVEDYIKDLKQNQGATKNDMESVPIQTDN